MSKYTFINEQSNTGIEEFYPSNGKVTFEFETDGAQQLVETFAAFMKACEFHPETVKEYINIE